MEPSGPNRRQGRSAQWSLSGPLAARLLSPAAQAAGPRAPRAGSELGLGDAEATDLARSGQGLPLGAGPVAVAQAVE